MKARQVHITERCAGKVTTARNSLALQNHLESLPNETDSSVKAEGKNLTAFPVLKTDRLTLRQLQHTDDKEIFALRSNEATNRFLDRQPSKSIEDARYFIQTIIENSQMTSSLYWAIALSQTNKLVGTICLFNFSDEIAKAEIGYELTPNFQGKGIMQEAMSAVVDFGIRELGLHLIEARTHSENERSIRLLDKFLFERHAACGDNVVLYRLTRDGRKNNIEPQKAHR